jgi:hypothetical protein
MSIARQQAHQSRSPGAGAPGPANAPTARRPAALAAELRELAKEPRVAPHQVALNELAEAVSSGEGLAQWAGGGLLAAYAGPDALAPDPGRRGRWARRLEAASSVLVFLPLLLTWSGLGAAVLAYRQLSGTRADASASFLALWQQGFQGHLWAPLRFDLVVGYTVALLLGLITVTLLRQRWEAQDERERSALLQRLAGALAQAEALAARAAHTEPRRFARELQDAASGLRALIDLSAGAQERSRDLLAQALAASGEAVTAVRSMQEAAATLRAGTLQASRASREAAAAADRLGKGADRLGGTVTDAVSGMSTGMDESAARAARRIADAAEAAARRFDAVLAGAVEIQARQAAEQSAGWERRGRAAEDALTASREELIRAAKALADTTAGLDRSVTGLPTALEGAAADGADRIGTAYELAVAALAVSLRGEVEQAAAAIGDQVALLGAALTQQETRAAVARGADRDAEQRLLASAAESREALRALSALLESVTERWQTLSAQARTPEPAQDAVPAPAPEPSRGPDPLRTLDAVQDRIPDPVPAQGQAQDRVPVPAAHPVLDRGPQPRRLTGTVQGQAPGPVPDVPDVPQVPEAEP